MHVQVPLIEIGMIVGTIRVERIPVLVVDGGHHGILLESDLIQKAFAVGKEEGEVSVTSPWKEDSEALPIELYPLKMCPSVS
jgi:hypothetical protein